MILCLRTDSPQAEIYLYDTATEVASDIWLAERTLARDLLKHIDILLRQHNLSWNDLRGIVVFQGPGSFTGLRIGLTVANTLAYAQQIPIIGATGTEWIPTGIHQLKSTYDRSTVLPVYDAAPRITQPRK